MRVWIKENKKEFVCRQCGSFFNANDLIDSCCPNCETDDDLFINDLNDD